MAETATGLKRGLALLLALEGGELGVTQVADLVGREKSQVSRTLKVLADAGLVERDPDTLTYRLGWRVFTLAARAGEQRLAEAGPRCLRRLVATFDEAAHLSVLRDSHVLTVLSESPAQGLQAVNLVGRVVPVVCTSAGYALLVDHERNEVGRLLPDAGFRRRHPLGPQSVDELWERIVATRDRGFALVSEELEPGLVAIGAPVRDFRGRIVAAINVSAPAFRFADRVEHAGEEVRTAATELSNALGRHST